MNIVFVTNIRTHYVIRLFELLAAKYKMMFYFTGGYEAYWEKRNKLWSGNFPNCDLKGFFLAPGFKVTPGLFNLPFKKIDVFIKTVDDRFALLFIFLTAKLKKRPFILWTGIWDHPQTWLHRRTFCITMMIYRHADAIVVYGQHVEKYLETLGVDSKKIFIAPHSVDNERFNSRVSEMEKRDLKEQLGLSEGRMILYVGRLEQCKGLDDLIEAVAGIRQIPFHLVFIGDGSARQRLEEKCQQQAIFYKFLNHIPNKELYRYYAIADIFVLPSVTTKHFKEPWGLVVNEAMNQGCPVVATDAVGAAAGGLVEDGSNGYIVPEKNSCALKEAIEKLLKDDDLRIVMSQNAKEKIKRWTPEQTVTGFVQAIDFVMLHT
jgi:glycosyltransferase involved in cell wall biosynthesis